MNKNLSNITTPIRSFWDELVERRLWPVAVALVLAVVAVPILLSKPAKPAAPVPPAPAAAAAASPGVAFQPAVSTEGKKSTQIRKDLRTFKKKNPFTPQGLNTAAPSASAAGTATAAGAVTTSPTATATTGAPTGGGSSTTGSTGSGSTGSGSSGSTGTTTKTFYYHYTVDVSFGKTGNPDNKTLTEFRPLPGSDNPVLVFMGVKNDGKTATFLVSANATTVGDGKCSPSDTVCTFLYMKKGDKQTIEAVDKTGAVTDYALKLRSIDVRRTSAPKKAQSSKSSRAAARRESRAHLRTIVNTFQTLGL
jgi:hypothetical protein